MKYYKLQAGRSRGDKVNKKARLAQGKKTGILGNYPEIPDS